VSARERPQQPQRLDIPPGDAAALRELGVKPAGGWNRTVLFGNFLMFSIDWWFSPRVSGGRRWTGRQVARCGTSGQAHSGTSGQAHSGTSGLAHSGTSGQAHSGTSGQAHSGTSGQARSGTSGQAHSGTSGLAHSGTSGLAPRGCAKVRRTTPRVAAPGRLTSRAALAHARATLGAPGRQVWEFTQLCRASGGAFTYRWNEQGVIAMLNQIFVKPEQFHFFTFKYAHRIPPATALRMVASPLPDAGGGAGTAGT
jgi:hypothetical protein